MSYKFQIVVKMNHLFTCALQLLAKRARSLNLGNVSMEYGLQFANPQSLSDSPFTVPGIFMKSSHHALHGYENCKARIKSRNDVILIILTRYFLETNLFCCEYKIPCFNALVVSGLMSKL